MNGVADIESVEEMLRFLEAGNQAVTETGEPIGKPVVFVGQLNEKNEEGLMRVNVVVTSMDEDVLIRYIEPVGFAEIPDEGMRESEEMKLMYARMKKEFDVMVEKVEARKKQLMELFEGKEYPSFLGVLS